VRRFYKFKVYTSKQKRGVTPQIQREMRRRSAVEPVIGHTKNEHRMDRNYLAHRHGAAPNAARNVRSHRRNFAVASKKSICWPPDSITLN
jgi:IS5 family transposase